MRATTSSIQKSGRAGHQITLTRKDPDTGRSEATILEKSEETLVPKTPNEQMTATVGLSVSMGMSTDFVREKLEVSAWCSLPCVPDMEAMNAAYEDCYNHVTSQVELRFNQAKKQLFPNME